MLCLSFPFWVSTVNGGGLHIPFKGQENVPVTEIVLSPYPIQGRCWELCGHHLTSFFMQIKAAFSIRLGRRLKSIDISSLALPLCVLIFKNHQIFIVGVSLDMQQDLFPL